MSSAAELVARMDRLAAPAAPSPAPVAVPAPATPATRAVSRSGGGRRRRGRAEAAGAVRYTVDLDPELHRGLRLYALHCRADASEVVRTLIELLREDEVLARAVCDRLGLL